MALCAGAGGLELGIKLALGDDYRCVVYVEREAYAAATLVARMADKALDSAPVWDDLATFDGRPWRGLVDVVSAGFPCQPWSDAGKRGGLEDDRWLWPVIARVLRQVEPEWVFLENVPGVVRGGLEPVLWTLAELGFDAEWCLLSAADCGAPHLRKRFFLLAHASRRSGAWESGHEGEQALGSRPVAERLGADVAHAQRSRAHERPGLDVQWGRSDPAQQVGLGGGDVAHPTSRGDIRRDEQARVLLRPEQRGQAVADASSERSREAGRLRAGSPLRAARSGEDLADATRGGLGERGQPPRGDGQPDGNRQAVADASGGFVPQSERGSRRRNGSGSASAVLAHATGSGFLAWQRDDDARRDEPDAPGRSTPLWPPGPSDRAGWSSMPPGSEPAICRDADGLAHRLDRLRTLGNGVVPVVAAMAFLRLRERLMEPAS